MPSEDRRGELDPTAYGPRGDHARAPASPLDGGCRVKQPIPASRVLVGDKATLARVWMPLSHESACQRALSMVVSHETLMHRSTEWFFRQPRRIRAAPARDAERDARCSFDSGRLHPPGAHDCSGRPPVVTDDDIGAAAFASGSERDPIVRRCARSSSRASVRAASPATTASHGGCRTNGGGVRRV
jgi:hypothetical protein